MTKRLSSRMWRGYVLACSSISKMGFALSAIIMWILLTLLSIMIIVPVASVGCSIVIAIYCWGKLKTSWDDTGNAWSRRND